MIGAIVNTLNVRLDASALAFCLCHSEAKVLITYTEFAPTVKQALSKVGRANITVIDIVDSESDFVDGERLGGIDYEAFIDSGDPVFEYGLTDDEWNAISLN